MYFLKISFCDLFLVSNIASSCVLSGLGNVILAHSFKSVTLLLLESYTFSHGSYTCLVLASNSCALAISSCVISLYSSSFTISILSLASAASCSCSNSCSLSLSTMQNLGCNCSTSFSALDSSTCPITTTS